MNEYNICGVLVHARPDCLQQVKNNLQHMKGVEVHEMTSEGRMIVTIEAEQRRVVANTLTNFYNVEGVLSANMVYQFCDDIAASEEGIPA